MAFRGGAPENGGGTERSMKFVKMKKAGEVKRSTGIGFYVGSAMILDAITRY